jgi:hypothetical protein
MATTKEAVDQWFAQNPNASATQIATAIESAGGLTAELANVLADRFQTTPTVIAQEVAKASPAPAAPSYFEARPDVAAAYQPNSFLGIGLTPEQFAAAHYARFGTNEGTAAPTSTGNKIITDSSGKSYDFNTLKTLASQLSTIADPSIMNGGVFGVEKGNIGFAYNDLAGALGAAPTTYDQVLMDAARGLLAKGITDVNQIKPPEGADANYTGDGVNAGSTTTGSGKTTYGIDFYNGKPTFHTAGESTNFFSSDLGKAALIGGSILGAPMLSSAIGGATGLTGAGLAGATGAALGGTAAGLTGGNVLTGALTGGLLGYGGATIADALSTPTVDASGTGGSKMLDYSAPTSTGGLGLQGTAAMDGTLSSGLAAPASGSLGGGLGLTASSAANLAAMGGAQGLVANAAGGGTLSAAGINSGLLTADNLAKTLAGGGTAAATLTDTLKNLTPSQVASLAKAGISVAGLLASGAAVAGIGGGSGGTGMLTPQDRSGISSGSAQYSPEYYQAIQAKYNQMMPQQPRDVTTDLKSWYETKYAPTAPTAQKVI